MGIGRPPAPIDIPDDEIEVRFQIAKAALRGRYHVDAWAQRGSKPLGCRLEDWAPLAGELPTHDSVHGRTNSRKGPNRQWARGAYTSPCYGTRAPQRLRQSS